METKPFALQLKRNFSAYQNLVGQLKENLNFYSVIVSLSSLLITNL